MIALLLLALFTMPDFTVGAELPVIDVVDDTGRVRSTAEFRGAPMILVPLFTRCPLACPMIVRGVKRGTLGARATPSSYRVVVLSFDERDTPADLRRFRERNQIPLSWTVVHARKGGARRLLDAAGYRYADTGGQFTHPNAVVAVTRNGRTAKWLHGTSWEGRDIDDALAVAEGRRDWITQAAPWLLGLLIVVAILAAISLMTLAGQWRERRVSA
ncbi:MAG TPA: SCO family protein [Thermoanaerobaculia bacterium]|nr:SCO family protein [Thermoanaerobaculia bacterium]